VYGLKMLNVSITTLNNVTGNAYHDTWIEGNVNTVTGAGYNPVGVFQTFGLHNSLPSLAIMNGPSYPVNMGTSDSSQFSLTNGEGKFLLDAGGNGRLGNNLSVGASQLSLSMGTIGLDKVTPSNSAPGAGGLKLEVVCGTQPGTAKLQAYAGTSTTPVKVLDNIGSGVSGC
jgi:hypothetical protein